jgi:4-diphosphocytidyl-2-C-methyl-D-erythritol kinase
MTQTMNRCPAPAKLNLFLHITGQRADGYHLLQSVFQLIDHGDTLDFSVRDDDEVHRTNEIAGLPEDQDLVIRAARALQAAALEKSGRRMPGADIALEKNLPMGGGLGGGSSDAATTLIVLNHLWQAGLTRAELMQLALPLGADIPFFLFGQNAFAEGVGESLVAVDTPDCWYVVIEPGVMVPTAAIFNASQLTRDTKPVRITDFSEASENFGRNDLQRVAAGLFPPIAEAITWLGAFGNARMTGSGACVFCAFAQERQADEVLRSVPARWRSWKAKALARHPLEHLL